MLDNNNYFNLNDRQLLFPNALVKTFRERSLLTSKSSRKKLSIDLTNHFNINLTSRLPSQQNKAVLETQLSNNSLPRQTRKKNSADLTTSFLKGFLTIERKSQNLLQIVNKKWDKNIEDCIKISYLERFLEVISERKSNVSELIDEILGRVRNTLESSGESNLLDSLKLVFAEQNQIMKSYEDYLRKNTETIAQAHKRTLRTEQSPNLAHSPEKANSSFNELFELLRILLKIFLKRFTDMTVFLENQDEGLWNNRLNSLKMKFRLRKGSEELIKTIEDFESLFQELMGKVTELTNENMQLSKECEALRKSIEKSFLFSKVETQELLTKPPASLDFSKQSFDFLNKFENIFKKSQDELRNRNEDLTEEVSRLKRQLDEKQELLNDRNKNRKLLKRNQENYKEDKEVQINLGAILENSRKSPLVHPETNPLTNYIGLSLNAYKLEDFYIKSLINLILSDKLFDDYRDFSERTPIKPFKVYICEWFLSRFGNQTFSETLMKDFLGSILASVAENDRFSLMARFCGVSLESFNRRVKGKNDGLDEFLVIFEETQDKSAITNEFLNSFYCSPQAITVFLKLAHYFKHRDPEFDIYGPILPDYSEEQNLIPYETADRLLKSLLEEELNDEHSAFEIANAFNLMVSSEKLPKMVRNSVTIQAGISPRRNSQINPQINQKRFGSIDMTNGPFSSVLGSPNTMLKGKVTDALIPFDILAKFILDNLAKNFALKAEVIVTSLKLCQANRKVNDFYIDDFITVIGKQFSNRSQKWLINSFSEFIQRNKKHEISGIYAMVFNHSEHLMKSEVNEKFYIENFERKDVPKSPSKELKDETPMNFEGLSSSQARSLKKKKTATLLTMKKSTIDDKELNQVIYEKNYSYRDSIIVLMHTYNCLKESIRREELGNEMLEMSHEIFRKEITKFPQNLHLVKGNYWNKFVGYDRNELLGRIESCWKTLRLIIDCVYSRGEKKDKQYIY